MSDSTKKLFIIKNTKSKSSSPVRHSSEIDISNKSKENKIEKLKYSLGNKDIPPITNDDLTEFTYEYLHNLPNCTLLGRGESIYMGQVVKLKRHGIGVAKYKSGRLYQGQWKDDLRDGYGKEKYANCHIYQGHYVKGKPQGKGVYLWPSGDSYVGEWYQGVKQGYGKWKNTNNESYTGNWDRGKINGYGVYVYSDNSKYEGEWKDFKKHGKGVEISPIGMVTVGNFTSGFMQGYGTRICPDGSIYKGNFINTKINGIGIWRKGMAETANIYEGEFKDEKKHGKGKFTWGATGNVYDGDFYEDKRQGFGIYTWLDGTKYVGEWMNDKQHGKGKMVYPEGDRQIGEYVDGKYQEVPYKPIDKRKQILKMIEGVFKSVENRAILAVGGDHCNPECRPRSQYGRLRGIKRNKSINLVKNLDQCNELSYKSLSTYSKRNILEDTFENTENKTSMKIQLKTLNNKQKLKSIARLRLKSACIYKPRCKEIRKSVLGGDTSTYANSQLDTRPKSRDGISSINNMTVELESKKNKSRKEKARFSRPNSTFQRNRKCDLFDISSKLAENLAKIQQE